MQMNVIISNKVKNILKLMDMEQGLYAKVVMLSIKDFKIPEENKNKNEDQFKFQCLSARS